MTPLEEQVYAIAAQEIAQKRFAPGLMAKAFSDADGDKDRTVARYIKLRVQQLHDEIQAETNRRHDHELNEQEQLLARQRDEVLKRRLENSDLIGNYPNACGSCEHFKRRDADVRFLGECLQHSKTAYTTWRCTDYRLHP